MDDVPPDIPSNIAPDINWQVKVLSRVSSTQDIVNLAAQDGDPEGYVVQALQQASGRGRHGNQWQSPMGNIYMSVLLRPECKVSRAGEFAFVVAVALYEALRGYIDETKHNITLKWPNDILVNGLKISGILLESHIKEEKMTGLVIGIGVNILTPPESAISLQDVSKEQVFVNKVRDKILLELDNAYAQWKKEGFAPFRERWLGHAHGIGQAMTARLPNVSYDGVFNGLTEDGSLILKMPDGVEKIITSGDVHFGGAE